MKAIKATDLKALQLEAVPFFPGRVRCQVCGEAWRVPVQYPRERLARGWWRCRTGCNAVAGDALYARAAEKSRDRRAINRVKGQGHVPARELAGA